MAWNHYTDWVKIGDLWWSTKDLDIFVPGVSMTETGWDTDGNPLCLIWEGKYYYTTFQYPHNAAAVAAVLPDGVELPSFADWNTLVDLLGGPSAAGHAMKAASFGGSNSSGLGIVVSPNLDMPVPGVVMYPSNADSTTYTPTPPDPPIAYTVAHMGADQGTTTNFTLSSDVVTLENYNPYAYNRMRVIRRTPPPPAPLTAAPIVLSVTPRQVYPGGRVSVSGLNFSPVSAVEVPAGSNVLQAGKTDTEMVLRLPLSATPGRYPLHMVGTFGELDLEWVEVVAVGGLDPHLPTNRTASDYRDLLLDLLPKGPAWTRRAGSWLWKLLDALSEELHRIHTAAADILARSRPSGALPNLTDWENELGLPGPCSPSLSPVDSARLAQIVQKANNAGGCSAEYFEEVAALFGYAATVTETYPDAHPFKVGQAKAGDAISQGPNLFQWVVHVTIPSEAVHVFQAGAGRAGDPLRWWALEELECFFELIKPAHTLVHFTYSA